MIIKTSYPFMKPPPSARLIRGNRLAQGLVGYWLMNEGSGTKVFDLSGNGNTGAIASEHWRVGKFGSCLYFDGIQDYINVGDIPIYDFAGDFSILVWFKAPALARSNLVYKGATGAGGKRYQIVFRNDGHLRFEIDDDSDSKNIETNAEYDDDLWHQIVVVRDGTNIRLYADNLEVPESPVDIGAYNTLANAEPLVFGIESEDLATDDFKGYIDHVMMWNRALSVFEITLLYRKPFCMFERKARTALMMPSVGAPPAGNAGIMTTNTGYWGATFENG